MVGAIDIVEELMQDQPSLRRLGINLGVDAIKLITTLFSVVGLHGWAMASMAGVAVAVPVWVVAAGALLAGVAIGVGLDEVDRTLGLTDALQRYAALLSNAQSGKW